ncbi:family 16 glycosylhydrolase [Marinimicrobium sp. C6131]|uniref:glycoside hydrolase family 16 protein n=1 Tax=Marinimicrobium sp. C6131 TaxID=3022676 RepID=UPI00223D82EB|nr:glycoside hydrolase family 16 protein [Marinimicrobium sp. C6131]UZJ43375.1 family 16 glycosylhydrolase [Marinimicrobium sp. C6131]
MKTVNYPVIGLGMALLMVAGCGSDSDDSPDSSSSSVSSSSSSSSSSDSSSSAAGGLSENWTLVWSDEFEGESINTENWSHEVNCAGGGNNELQCYTAREENSYVEDGHLHIVARQESFSGPGVFDDDPAYNPDDTSVTREYTSARLRTKNKADWKYGRIEVSAKTPQGQGLWPAIWMLPTENVYGGWPLSGEIDIFEAVNTNASGENEIHGTLHYGRPWPNNLNSGASYSPEEPIWENFHTYAIEWEEGEIRWYVDDVHFATQTADDWFTLDWQGQDEGFQTGNPASPFDEMFHLIMNVAVGGNWPGAPDGATTFPQELVVDYVRVYQCDVDPDNGKGCAWIDESAEDVDGTGGTQQAFALYEDGPATLNFSVFDTDVSNTLVPAQWEETAGNLVVDTALQVDDQTVWDVQFNGLSNVFLLSGDMSEVDYVEDGFSFSLNEALSGITFDMRVIDASEDASLRVKLDSVWPNVSSRDIELPETGVWQSVSVRFSDFVANADEPGEVNYSDINAPFVLEATNGTAHVQLNNIRVTCFGQSCGVNPKLDGTAPEGTEAVDVFVDGSLTDTWSDPGVDFYVQDGQSITSSLVNDGDRGDVLELTFGANGFGTMFIQSSEPQDLSAYAAGNLVFDLKVMDAGNNSDGFLVKADCIYPCTSNELAVPLQNDGQWHTVSVSIADLTSGSGFIMNRVNTPFSLWPVMGQQSNVVFRLDNIRWELSE